MGDQMNDDLVPEGAHWHSIMIHDMDKSSGYQAILSAMPTIEEARAFLADTLQAQEHEADKRFTTEQRGGFYDEMREGKWDYVADHQFCVAIYPCIGDDDKECRAIGDSMTVRIIRMETALAAICTCPKHSAVRASKPSTVVVGLSGLLAAAAAFTTTEDEPHTGMYL